MSHLKKAEKSRLHAKNRRGEEANEIAKIAELLPLPDAVKSRLDKASILRLAITFLRLKQYVGEDEDLNEQLQHFGVDNEGSLMLEALSGFFIIVSAQEEVLFVSENVEKHCGLKQLDVIGKNVFEFILDTDQPELQAQFTDKYKTVSNCNVSGYGINSQGDLVSMSLSSSILNAQGEDSGGVQFEKHRQFFLRMRCNYSKKTTPSHIATNHSDYVLLQWTGYVHHDADQKISFLAAVARPLQPTPIMELRMDGNMFISRHSLDMRFMYCDPRLSSILGYEPEEMSGSSMFQYHHAGDLDMCKSCHSNLMMAGTSISKYYRFLSKDNQWCWLQTRATIVYNTAKHPQYIVCMNYIVSEKEGRRYLMDHLKPEGSSRNKRKCAPGDVSHGPVEGLSTNLSDIQITERPGVKQELASPDPSPANHQYYNNQSSTGQSPLSQSSSSFSPTSQSNHSYSPTSQSPGSQSPVRNRAGPHVHMPDPHVLQNLANMSNNADPTFYLPHQAGKPDTTVYDEQHQQPPQEDLALGNLWLSVHSLVDPTRSHYTQEITPPNLASELEDISFEHCNRLMKQSTADVIETYAKEETDPQLDNQAGQAWNIASQVIDRQAQTLFKRFKSSEPCEMKRSISSSSMAASTPGYATGTRSTTSCSETPTPPPIDIEIQSNIRLNPSSGFLTTLASHIPMVPEAAEQRQHVSATQPQPQNIILQPQNNMHQPQTTIHQPQTTVHQPQANVIQTQSNIHQQAANIQQTQQNNIHQPLQNNIHQPQAPIHQPQNNVHQPQTSMHQQVPMHEQISYTANDFQTSEIADLLDEYPDILDSQPYSLPDYDSFLSERTHPSQPLDMPLVNNVDVMVSGGVIPSNSSLMSLDEAPPSLTRTQSGLKRSNTSHKYLDRLDSTVYLTNQDSQCVPPRVDSNSMDFDSHHDSLGGLSPSYDDNSHASVLDKFNESAVIDYWMQS